MQSDTGQVQTRKDGDAGRKLRLRTFADLDGRTRAKQQAEELFERLVAERGGRENMDVAQIAYAESFCCLTVLLKDQYTRLMSGESVDLSTIATLTNSRGREGDRMGGPSPRNVTDLQTYLAEAYPDDHRVQTPTPHTADSDRD